MGNRSSTISRRYRIDKDADISVTASIGEGQPGGWSIAVDNRFVAEGHGKKTVTLGKGRDLVFRELRLEYVIHDRRWEHDHLRATTVLTGGPEEMAITHEKDGEPGDSATYTLLVQFI